MSFHVGYLVWGAEQSKHNTEFLKNAFSRVQLGVVQMEASSNCWTERTLSTEGCANDQGPENYSSTLYFKNTPHKGKIEVVCLTNSEVLLQLQLM